MIEFLFMKHCKHGNSKTVFSGEVYGKTIPRLEMVDINMTILELKKHFYNTQLKHIYKQDHPIHDSEAELNKCIVFQVYDNLPYYTESKYSRRKA